MPPDSALVAETRAWLAKAREDLEATELLLGGGSPLPSPAAFHAQQAAKKAQKAFLTWHKQIFTKTHDLGVLGAKCVAIDVTLETVSSSVASVRSYAVEARYPGPWDEPTVAEAQEAVKLAREMYNALIARLPDEAKP